MIVRNGRSRRLNYDGQWSMTVALYSTPIPPPMPTPPNWPPANYTEAYGGMTITAPWGGWVRFARAYEVYNGLYYSLGIRLTCGNGSSTYADNIYWAMYRVYQPPSAPNVTWTYTLGGTFRLECDVEDCQQIDIQAPARPTTLDYDPPPYTTINGVERTKLTGSMSASITATGLGGSSGSSAITSQQYLSSIYALNFDASYSWRQVTGDMSASAVFGAGLYGDQQQGVPLSTDATWTTSDPITVDDRSGVHISGQNTTTTLWTVSNQVAISPPRSFDLGGVIRAMQDPYPDGIAVHVDEYAGGGEGKLYTCSDSFTAGHAQRWWSAAATVNGVTMTPNPWAVNEQCSVRAWVDADALASAHEGDVDQLADQAQIPPQRDTRILLLGSYRQIATITQSAAAVVDDCSGGYIDSDGRLRTAASNAYGYWTATGGALGYTTISVYVAATANGATLSRHLELDPAQGAAPPTVTPIPSFGGYRYLAIALRPVDGSGSVVVDQRYPVTITCNGYEDGWERVPQVTKTYTIDGPRSGEYLADGYAHRLIDLAHPDTTGTAEGGAATGVRSIGISNGVTTVTYYCEEAVEPGVQSVNTDADLPGPSYRSPSMSGIGVPAFESPPASKLGDSYSIDNPGGPAITVGGIAAGVTMNVKGITLTRQDPKPHITTLPSYRWWARADRRDEPAAMPGSEVWFKGYRGDPPDGALLTHIHADRLLSATVDGARGLDVNGCIRSMIETRSGDGNTLTYSDQTAKQVLDALTHATPVYNRYYRSTPPYDLVSVLLGAYYGRYGWSATYDGSEAANRAAEDAGQELDIGQYLCNGYRMANWLNGGGWRYTREGSESQPSWKCSVDDTTGVMVVQERMDVFGWPPEWGDGFGFVDGSYGGPTHIAASKILRGSARGYEWSSGALRDVSLIQTAHPSPAPPTGEVRTTAAVDASTNYWATGLPHGRSHMTHALEPTSTTSYAIYDVLYPRKQSRAAFGFAATPQWKAIIDDLKRTWMLISDSSVIRQYDDPGWTLLHAGPTHPDTPSWIRLRTERHRGATLMAGQPAAGTINVCYSLDGGDSYQEVMRVTANSVAIEYDEHRSTWLILIENGGTITRRTSDDGIVWSSETASGLSGTILDSTYSRRYGEVAVVVRSAGGVATVYTTDDLGVTWTARLT